MMITIHGFPVKTKYQDVKTLIKQECHITDFILDNLVSDSDGTKKVRIGLTDNSEGYRVMKSLDGYRLAGNFVLKAIPVGKAASTLPQQSSYDSRPGYQNQQTNDYNAPRNDYMGQHPNDYNNQGPHGSSVSHGHGGLHAASGLHGPGASMGSRASHGHGGHAPSGTHVPMENMNRPSPWASGGNNSNSWNSNPAMASQIPQNIFGFNSPQANMNSGFGQQQQHNQGHSRSEMKPFNQGRPVPDQNYGYTPKNNVPDVPADPRFLAGRGPNKRNTKQKQPLNVATSSYTSERMPSYPSAVSSESPYSTTATGFSFQDDIAPNSPIAEPDESSEDLDPVAIKGSNKLKKKEKFRKRDITKLAGAARRRLWWWKKQGKSFTEARELCETKFKQVPEYLSAREASKTRLYERAQRRMSPATLEKEKRLARLKGPPPGSNQEKPKDPPIRVRIVDALGYMSEEKLDLLQDKILELIDTEVDENGPNFVGCFQQSGSLILRCVNENTLEWLRKHISNIEPWEGASLSLINLSELPKPLVAVAYIPDDKLDEESILRMLKTQNKDFDFSDWWITFRKIEDEGQTVTLSIDQSSLQKLIDRSNWLYLGFKKIKIRIKASKQKCPAPDNLNQAMPESSGNQSDGRKVSQNKPRGGKTKAMSSRESQQYYRAGGPPGRGSFQSNFGKRGRGGKSRGKNKTLNAEQCADRSRFVWRKSEDQPPFYN